MGRMLQNNCKGKLFHRLTYTVFTSYSILGIDCIVEKMMTFGYLQAVLPVFSNACYHHSVLNICHFCSLIIADTEKYANS